MVGTQRLGGESDKTELTTIGTLEETNDSLIIGYTEEYEPSSESVNVSVTANRDGSFAEMVRHGKNGSVLTIEKSKRNLCRYGTEYGDILLGISGHGNEVGFDGEKGEIVFAYDIDVNGALVSKNEVRLTFRKTAN